MPSPEYFNMMNQLENIRYEQKRTADALNKTTSSGISSSIFDFSFKKLLIAIIVIFILGGLSFLTMIGYAFIVGLST